MSSNEAEYVAICRAAPEALVLLRRHLIASSNVEGLQPTTIHGDNERAIRNAELNIWSEHSRHVVIEYHYNRDQLKGVGIRRILIAREGAACYSQKTIRSILLACYIPVRGRNHQPLKCFECEYDHGQSSLEDGFQQIFVCESTELMAWGGIAVQELCQSSNYTDTSREYLYCRYRLQ